jgi:hypothetical protein
MGIFAHYERYGDNTNRRWKFLISHQLAILLLFAIFVFNK